MLDQNADRQYWMIGAVIVVGLMIAVLKVAFPGLITSVIDAFQAKLTAGI